jgi:hypothetical protein
MCSGLVVANGDSNSSVPALVTDSDNGDSTATESE